MLFAFATQKMSETLVNAVANCKCAPVVSTAGFPFSSITAAVAPSYICGWFTTAACSASLALLDWSVHVTTNPSALPQWAAIAAVSSSLFESYPMSVSVSPASSRMRMRLVAELDSRRTEYPAAAPVYVSNRPSKLGNVIPDIDPIVAEVTADSESISPAEVPLNVLTVAIMGRY